MTAGAATQRRSRLSTQRPELSARLVAPFSFDSIPDPREPVDPFLADPVEALPLAGAFLEPALLAPLVEDFPVVAPRPAFFAFAMMSSWW